jgi:hypothetical protein
LDNYLKDSTAKWGPLGYKKRGVIPAVVQIQSLKLKILTLHSIKDVALNEYPSTVALSELIEPNGWWHILVMAHNKPLYELILSNRTGIPRFIRAAVPYPIGSEFKDNIWTPLLKAYPESSGINPTLVISSCRCNNRSDHYFLYFKQKGSRKIYYCDKRDYANTFDSLFTASIETLDDSKILIDHLKTCDTRITAEELKVLGKAKGIGDGKAEGSYPAFRQGGLRDDSANDLFPAGGSK